MRYWLGDSWYSLSFCCHTIEVHGQLRIPSICLQSCYDRSSTANLPIPFGNTAVEAVLCTLIRIWDTAHILVALPQHLPADDRCSDVPESSGNISLWLIDHCIFNYPSRQWRQSRQDEYLCHNLRHGLTNSWQSSSCGWHMTKVPVHWKILSISEWQIQHSIFAHLIWQ